MSTQTHPFLILAGRYNELQGEQGRFTVAMQRETAFNQIRHLVQSGWNVVMEHQGRVRVSINQYEDNEAGIEKAKTTFRDVCWNCSHEYLWFPQRKACPHCHALALPF